MMTSEALTAAREEMFSMLDQVARYTAVCERIEPELGRLIAYRKYRRYWQLNVKGGQEPGIFIRYDLDEADTLKVIKPILDLAVEQGWDAKPTEDFCGGYGVSYPFTQKVEIAGTAHTLHLTLRVFPHPDSQVCKKVEVGMEPKYEIRCSEGG